MNEMIFIIVIGITLGILKYILEQRRIKNVKNGKVVCAMLDKLKAVVPTVASSIVCYIMLTNSDNKISDALKYVEPSKHLDNIMEKLHEQAGI